jgi:glycine/D-amino acid oxidase-like deaminating enzyme
MLVRGRTALVNPARLAWGLRRPCLDAGVRLYENTPSTGLDAEPRRVRLTTPRGSVSAGRIALATNADRPLMRRIRPSVLPVYDYVLVTEPLSATQLASIGWGGRQGISDRGNQFHYYRLTADSRILWGGYDAIYHFGSRVDDRFDQRSATFDRLAGHFFSTFPQLHGVRFTHRWGGAIDTCSRFCAFWGRAMVAGLRTFSATPASAWALRVLGRRSCSISWRTAIPIEPPCAWFAPAPCRFLPRLCGTALSR